MISHSTIQDLENAIQPKQEPSSHFESLNEVVPRPAPLHHRPNSLWNMLRLKKIYYERSLDERSVLREVETRAAKLKRTHTTAQSSEATAYYHVNS